MKEHSYLPLVTCFCHAVKDHGVVTKGAEQLRIRLCSTNRSYGTATAVCNLMLQICCKIPEFRGRSQMLLWVFVHSTSLHCPTFELPLM